MKRIVIVGCAGAGKTTLARKLSAYLALPYVSLDYFFWQAGWIPVTREEKVQTQHRLVTQDKWVIEGNYDSTLEIRLNACDTVDAFVARIRAAGSSVEEADKIA